MNAGVAWLAAAVATFLGLCVYGLVDTGGSLTASPSGDFVWVWVIGTLSLQVFAALAVASWPIRSRGR